MKNILNTITGIIADAFTHYVCMRLHFRSSVMQDSLPEKNAVTCSPQCCPNQS